MAVLPPQLRVLVIDDDAIMRELLSALLSVEGHEVDTAEDGESALHALHRGITPEVILTDMQLPGVSGAALAAQLRASVPGAKLLAMSSSQPAAEIRAAFDGFLLKPFTPADFAAAAAVEKQLDSATSVVPAAAANFTEDAALDENIYAHLAQSLAPKQLAELYSLTLQDVDSRLDRLQEALKTNDLSTYHSEAHALKGGCSMVGAMELARLAAKAELSGGTSSDAPSAEIFAFAARRLRGILAARFGPAM